MCCAVYDASLTSAVACAPADQHPNMARWHLRVWRSVLVAVLLPPIPRGLLGLHVCSSTCHMRLTRIVERVEADAASRVPSQIEVGGDVDTTAAMAGAISGAYNGLAAIQR